MSILIEKKRLVLICKVFLCEMRSLVYIFNVSVIPAQNVFEIIFSAMTPSVTFWPCGLHSIHRLMQRQQQDELPLLLDQLMSMVRGTKFRGMQWECKYRRDKNQSAGKLRDRGAEKSRQQCQ